MGRPEKAPVSEGAEGQASKDVVGQGEAGGLSRPSGHTVKEAESSSQVLGAAPKATRLGLDFQKQTIQHVKGKRPSGILPPLPIPGLQRHGGKEGL